MEQQKPYMRWIEKILDLDRRTTKNPRLYCAYCDMNNHPRFSRKRAYKHKNPDARHRCTLCAGRHPPFLCPKAQVNGHKSMVVMRSLTGTKPSTSLQRKKVESLIIDGERMSVMSMLILPLKVLNDQQQIRSLSVQQQQ